MRFELKIRPVMPPRRANIAAKSIIWAQNGNHIVMEKSISQGRGSDLLTDAAAWRGGYISRLEKRYGSELRFSEIDASAARSLGRREGSYCTVTGEDAARALAYAMRRMRGAERVLFAGLGNESFASDALGGKTVDALRRVTCGKNIATFRPEVQAVTGLDTAKVVAAVARDYAPDLVIVADALATTDWRKVGACYQLTTAGLCPGSGTGTGGICIDSAFVGANVLAVGVPLICLMSTEEGERRVIPYDAESVVDRCARTIAAAVYAAYS